MTKQRDFTDSRIPDRSTCALRYLIDRWADERGDQTYVHFENGSKWSYAELKRRVVEKAAGLRALGVGQGDHVALWLRNAKCRQCEAQARNRALAKSRAAESRRKKQVATA